MHGLGRRTRTSQEILQLDVIMERRVGVSCSMLYRPYKDVTRQKDSSNISSEGPRSAPSTLGIQWREEHSLWMTVQQDTIMVYLGTLVPNEAYIATATQAGFFVSRLGSPRMRRAQLK